jgi:hypothetical protein
LIWLRIGTSCWALVNTVMILRVPLIAGKFFSSYTIGGFSERLNSMKLVSFKTLKAWHLIRKNLPEVSSQ